MHGCFVSSKSVCSLKRCAVDVTLPSKLTCALHSQLKLLCFDLTGQSCVKFWSAMPRDRLWGGAREPRLIAQHSFAEALKLVAWRVTGAQNHSELKSCQHATHWHLLTDASTNGSMALLSKDIQNKNRTAFSSLKTVSAKCSILPNSSSSFEHKLVGSSDDDMPHARNVALNDSYKTLLMSCSCLLLMCFCMCRTPCLHPSG